MFIKSCTTASLRGLYSITTSAKSAGKISFIESVSTPFLSLGLLTKINFVWQAGQVAKFRSLSNALGRNTWWQAGQPNTPGPGLRLIGSRLHGISWSGQGRFRWVSVWSITTAWVLFTAGLKLLPIAWNQTVKLLVGRVNWIASMLGISTPGRDDGMLA